MPWGAPGATVDWKLGLATLKPTSVPLSSMGGNPRIPAQAEVESQFRVRLPVVLHVEGRTQLAQIHLAPVVHVKAGLVAGIEIGKGVAGLA